MAEVHRSGMSIVVRTQLSVMMFIQFFIWGAWFVTMWPYLHKLGFDDVQKGAAYSTTAWAAIVSPFIVGMIVDRFFSAEKVMGVLHLAGGVVMFWVATIHEPGLFFWVLLLYSICYMPTLALVNSISFDHMDDPGREFPAIRVLGTIGWIVAGVIVGYVLPKWILHVETVEDTAIPMKLAAAMSILMGLFSFTLPHTPPKSIGRKVTISDVLGLKALKLLKDPSFTVFVACSFLICIPLSFYYQSANGFLNELGMKNSAAKMTLGQISEIFFMLVMPFFLVRLGVKKMLLVGMLFWVGRYILFAYGNNANLVYMLYFGILFHGICYDFFFVTGQIYVDKKAPLDIRASAQGFIAVITLGVGMVIGNYINGWVTRYYEVTDATIDSIAHNWKMIWLIPAGMAAVVLLLFFFLFKDEETKLEADRT